VPGKVFRFGQTEPVIANKEGFGLVPGKKSADHQEDASAEPKEEAPPSDIAEERDGLFVGFAAWGH
jgi:hypothetical protein